MSPFGLFSDDDCENTKEYLESLADFLESVLRNELRTPVDLETEHVEDQIVVLTAYAVYSLAGAAEENPNVDRDCEEAIGQAMRPVAKKWAGIAQSNDVEKRLFERFIGIAAGAPSYKRGLDQVIEFGFERLSEDQGETSMKESASLLHTLHKAESMLVPAVDRHDADYSYQTWISGKIAFEAGSQYGREMAEKINGYLRRNYDVRAGEDSLGRYEEAVVGIFYLCCIPQLGRKGEEGKALLSSSLFALKQSLEGLPDSSDLRTVSYALLLVSSPTSLSAEEVKNIASWSIAHYRGNEFRWVMDWSGLSLPRDESLTGVVADALEFFDVRKSGI